VSRSVCSVRRSSVPCFPSSIHQWLDVETDQNGQKRELINLHEHAQENGSIQ
jgi:hypothetical protein